MRDCLPFIVALLICSPAMGGKHIPKSSHKIQAPLSAEQKAHLLDGEFSVVTAVGALPEGVRTALAQQFGQKKLELANPGQSFNAIDAGIPGQRLIFAGISKDKCFVYYEQGGIALMYRMIVFQIDAQQKVKFQWAGRGIHADDLQELRSAISAGRFVEVR